MRIVVSVAIALVLSASHPVNAAGKGKRPAVCKVDSDCTLVPADCCGCEDGGKQKAIPVRDEARYQKARRARCAETMCSAVVSQDSSCAITAAVCKEGQCSLAPSP